METFGGSNAKNNSQRCYSRFFIAGNSKRNRTIERTSVEYGIKTKKKYESGNKNGDKETVIIMARSCYEALSIDPTLPSGNYFIDPDGTNTGDSPIYVYCNMNTGFYIYALISYLSGT